MDDASPEMMSIFCGALELPAADERAVNAWIDLNEAAIRAHWD